MIFIYNVFRQYDTSYRKQEKIIPYIHLTILVVDFIKSPKKLCWSRAQVTFVRLLRAKVMWCFTCVWRDPQQVFVQRQVVVVVFWQWDTHSHGQKHILLECWLMAAGQRAGGSMTKTTVIVGRHKSLKTYCSCLLFLSRYFITFVGNFSIFM